MKRWPLDQEQLLRDMAREQVPIEEQMTRLGKSYTSIVNKRSMLGLSKPQTYGTPSDEVKKGVIQPDDEPPVDIEEREYTEGSDSAAVEIKGLHEGVSSLEDLIRVCKIDTDKWHVEKWKCKAYGGYIKNAKKQIEQVQLFSVSADLKIKKGIDFKKEFEVIIEEAKAHAPHIPRKYVMPRPGPGFGRKHMLELSVPDLHIGKLAWHEECGQSYDSEIAAQVFADAVASIIAKVRVYKFEKCVFVVGNDLLNADNSENMTTRGTPQSCDTRHQKTFRIAHKLIRDAVEHQLMKVAPCVEIVIVPGNHDQQTSWMLGEALSAWFRNTEGVTVNNDPKLRKYIEYGRVMLGYSHGDKEKHVDLPLLMAQEEKEMWGRTAFREFHVGHMHQRSAIRFRDIQENRGVVVRVLPSLCAPEDWHVSKGYVGNIRSAEAYIWHPDEGLVGTVVYNVPVE